MSTAEKPYPKTVAEAIELLHDNMSLNEEFFLANMDEQDLIELHSSLGTDVRNDLGLWDGNEALIQSCRDLSGNNDIHVDDASMVIIKALWEKVKESNLLKDP